MVNTGIQSYMYISGVIGATFNTCMAMDCKCTVYHFHDFFFENENELFARQSDIFSGGKLKKLLNKLS